MDQISKYELKKFLILSVGCVLIGFSTNIFVVIGVILIAIWSKYYA